jgi:DNA invertase Pin-like site-specific DNA recombinase
VRLSSHETSVWLLPSIECGQVADDCDGIPRQKESVRKYAAANDTRIVQWFEDAFTGPKELDHRPALQAMLSALDSNDVQLVVIERLDRLASRPDDSREYSQGTSTKWL